MSITVKLADGSAVLKDDNELTNKEVKLLRRSARHAAAIAEKLKKLGFDDKEPETWTVITELTDEEDNVLDEFQRTCVAIRLVSWTLDRELPTTPDEVDDLPRPIYVPLTVAAADIKLSDDFEISGVADPKADTESSDS